MRRKHTLISLNRLVKFLTVLSVCLLLVQPPEASSQKRRGIYKRESQAVRSQMLVTTAHLAERINDANLIVLHVAHERAHYDRGHIPGARFVSWGEITATRNGVPNELPPVADLVKLFERLGIGDEARILLYGDNAGLSAARAYFTLDYLGHGERAALLDGGLEKWRAEGKPISTESVEVRPAPFTPRLRVGVVTFLDVVRDISWEASNISRMNVVLVDADRPVHCCRRGRYVRGGAPGAPREGRAPASHVRLFRHYGGGLSGRREPPRHLLGARSKGEK